MKKHLLLPICLLIGCDIISSSEKAPLPADISGTYYSEPFEIFDIFEVTGAWQGTLYFRESREVSARFYYRVTITQTDDQVRLLIVSPVSCLEEVTILEGEGQGETRFREMSLDNIFKWDPMYWDGTYDRNLGLLTASVEDDFWGWELTAEVSQDAITFTLPSDISFWAETQREYTTTSGMNQYNTAESEFSKAFDGDVQFTVEL